MEHGVKSSRRDTISKSVGSPRECLKPSMAQLAAPQLRQTSSVSVLSLLRPVASKSSQTSPKSMLSGLLHAMKRAAVTRRVASVVRRLANSRVQVLRQARVRSALQEPVSRRVQ